MTSFQLPSLPYDYIALEPYIDTQTMYLHHKQHHNAYITKLNGAIGATGDDKTNTVSTKSMWSEDKELQEILKVAHSSSALIRNNAGGHYNHSMFWKWMAPPGTSNSAPHSSLKEKIELQFGSVTQMKSLFSEAAISQFGSGWAWLSVQKSDGSLKIESTANQDNPLMKGDCIPILGLDVWEHAYYLRYQNRRPEYVEKWWNVINWDAVVDGYEKYAVKGENMPI